MKNITIKLCNKKYNCIIDIKEYSNKYYNSKNRRKCIRLIDSIDSLPICTASINIPEYPLMEGYVIIKDYSENFGIYFQLVENCIISKLQTYANGNPICKLLIS
jgi:hypothetical protein